MPVFWGGKMVDKPPRVSNKGDLPLSAVLDIQMLRSEQMMLHHRLFISLSGSKDGGCCNRAGNRHGFNYTGRLKPFSIGLHWGLMSFLAMTSHPVTVMHTLDPQMRPTYAPLVWPALRVPAQSRRSLSWTHTLQQGLTT